MKKFALIFGLICGASLGSNLFAQERPAPRPSPEPTQRIVTSTMAVPLPLPPRMEVEIRDQPDSPIHLSVDEAARSRMPGTPIKVRNDGGSAVAAYVLRLDVEPYGLNQMVIVGPRGLAIGAVRIQGLPTMNLRGGSSKPLVSVDHVQFMDGTTWGEDSLRRSKDVAAYLKGRNEALARLQELLAGRDATDVNRALDTFSSSSFAEPNLPPGRPPRYVDYSVRGYEEVINILRRMPRNSELSKDLAARLEAMMKRSDQ